MNDDEVCDMCDGTGEGPYDTSCAYCRGSGFPKQYEAEEPFEVNYG